MSQLKSMALHHPGSALCAEYAPRWPDASLTSLAEYGSIFTYVTDAGDDVSLRPMIVRPDRFHIVYETGDNTTVAMGEGEPLNLNYGRGFHFGDHFQIWYDEIIDGDVTVDDADTLCYPSDPHGDLG